MDKFTCNKCFQKALLDINRPGIDNYVRIPPVVFRMVLRVVSSCNVCSDGVVFYGEMDIIYI